VLNSIKALTNLQDWQLERQLTVLAVSGGIDSMVLLQVFHQLKYPCIVAHLNFGLRGSESDGDTILVMQTCNALSIPCFVKHVDTEKYANENNLSIQMAARQIRYDFFQEILEGQKAYYIATAHQQDDELENFFIYLLRNQLHSAWQGIPKERGNIIRPLLNIPRKTIQEFASNNEVVFREDSSNASTKYLRNKIRHLLIPDLKNEFASVADDFQYISSLSRAESKLYLSNFQINWETEVSETYGKTGLSLEQINIPKSFYTKQVYQLGLRNKFLSWGFTNNQVNEILNNPINIGSHWIGREFVIYANRNGLTLKQRNKTEITESKIQVNEVVYFGDFQINMVEINKDQVDFNQPNCYYFNALIGNEELTIRSWKIGDKMQPLGMKGSKKLSDIFIDNKIDNDRKNDFPLLVSNNKICAILGLKRSAHFLLGESETAIKISWDTLN
jgi:tRNA(Ile)-lysidine synthase